MGENEFQVKCKWMDEQYLCWHGVPGPGLATIWLKGEEKCFNRVQYHVLKISASLSGKISTVVIAVNIKL